MVRDSTKLKHFVLGLCLAFWTILWVESSDRCPGDWVAKFARANQKWVGLFGLTGARQQQLVSGQQAQKSSPDS
eukprot:1628839-Amphidinium_carterae.2